jgi:hypothetical protein
MGTCKEDFCGDCKYLDRTVTGTHGYTQGFLCVKKQSFRSNGSVAPDNCFAHRGFKWPVQSSSE